MVLAYRNGNPLRLRDVANIIEAPENSRLAAWANQPQPWCCTFGASPARM